MSRVSVQVVRKDGKPLPPRALEVEELMSENKDRPGAGAPVGREVGATGSGQAPPQLAAQVKPSAGGAMNGADFQTYIGRGLRAVFDDVANQPVPDRFLELMKKLG